jgi:Glycosyl transferase family 11
MGQTGNQLFQLASMIGLSRMKGCELCLPAWKYAKYFAGIIPVRHPRGLQVSEPAFHYCGDFIPNDGKNYDVSGYLQSEKYWKHCEKEIRDMLKWEPGFLASIKRKYEHILSKETVAIHVRRGDYVNNPAYVNLPPLYYLRALIEKIPNWREKNLVFFSDDPSYVKFHYGCLDNACFPHGDEIDNLCLMTLCDHYIIANSSYSWWGAYLGEKPHSIVIRPQRHFSGSLAHTNIFDLYPEHWTAFNELSGKIPLKEMTFVIPMAYDHPDRLENLHLMIGLLKDNFDTNFSFIEQGGRKLGEFTPWRYFEGKYFHRTKMLNDAIRDARTPYAANYDGDVALPPAQILEAVERLKKGADIVYPYNGDFWHVTREPNCDNLKKHKDIGIFSSMKFRKTEHSRGGAVFMNIKTFFGAGGENENFISHGPEDQERWLRFTKLGLVVDFVKGCIIHMEHWRGKNSHSMQHQHGQQNQNEYQKISAMNEQQLKKYVATWKWAKM